MGTCLNPEHPGAEQRPPPMQTLGDRGERGQGELNLQPTQPLSVRAALQRGCGEAHQRMYEGCRSADFMNPIF